MTKNKRELLNDVLTGLLVAATFGAVAPDMAFAQLSTAVSSSASNVFTPVVTVISYISYAAGAMFIVRGIAAVKKHTDSPGQHNLGPGLGWLGTGAALVAAPALIGTLQQTGTQVMPGTAGYLPLNGVTQ